MRQCQIAPYYTEAFEDFDEALQELSALDGKLSARQRKRLHEEILHKGLKHLLEVNNSPMGKTTEELKCKEIVRKEGNVFGAVLNEYMNCNSVFEQQELILTWIRDRLLPLENRCFSCEGYQERENLTKRGGE
ncbi:hypothetical protein MTBPR1_80153 [Candidatus Terasakiella magnetica]|uniref:Uncharacterized protein n=1 Tax=Candidatus Terasakiella magnetica TaxID=1867952 RepID=A0A1C3RLT1_9PROT|nr:hypothetical protein [Candidatus Terasakiella magnetica]SCA58099.1 hypothetical protein MTBPR1_80153 [Candidatus Terasakiella magnetica]